jgi:hypothetical protein
MAVYIPRARVRTVSMALNPLIPGGRRYQSGLTTSRQECFNRYVDFMTLVDTEEGRDFSLDPVNVAQRLASILQSWPGDAEDRRDLPVLVRNAQRLINGLKRNCY